MSTKRKGVQLVLCAGCRSIQILGKKCGICGRKVVAWKKDKKGTK